MLFFSMPQAEYLLQSEIFQVCWSFPSPALPRGPVWVLLLHLPPESSHWDVPAEQARSEAPQPASWSNRSQSRYSEVYHRCILFLNRCQYICAEGYVLQKIAHSGSHLKSLLANVWAVWQSVWTDFVTCTLTAQYIFMMCSRWLVIFPLRQNQAPPIYVPLNRHHLFSPRELTATVM